MAHHGLGCPGATADPGFWSLGRVNVSQQQHAGIGSPYARRLVLSKAMGQVTSGK